MSEKQTKSTTLRQAFTEVMEDFDNPELRKESSERAFNSAKKLSDFIGMIARLVFLTVAYRYFFAEAFKNSGFRYWVLFTCGLNAFALSCWLANKIFTIILYWELRDVKAEVNVWVKVISVVIAMGGATISYLGAVHVAGELAKLSASLGE